MDMMMKVRVPCRLKCYIKSNYLVHTHFGSREKLFALKNCLVLADYDHIFPVRTYLDAGLMQTGTHWVGICIAK